MSDEQVKELELEDDLQDGLEDETEEGAVLDPGEKEGKGDPSDKMDADHPRFKKVYGKMKELERKLEEKGLSDEKTEAMIESMKAHNAQLAEKLTNTVSELKTDAVSTPDNFDSIMEQIEEASEIEDFGTVVKLQAKMFQQQIANITSVDPDDIVKKVTAAVSGSKDDDKFEKWKSENDWYNTNKQARIYSEALAGDMKADLEAGKITYDQFLTTVANDTKKLFRIKADDNETFAGVEMGDRTNHTVKHGKTSWSKADEEMRVAFNISIEDFAKQKTPARRV